MNKIKSIVCLGWLSMLALPVLGANNTVSMVTYFPVPYAAYNNIYVSKKFDVGTNTSDFTLNLGSSDSSTSLLADDIFLRKVQPGSSLSFLTDIYTPTAQFGNMNTIQPVTLNFAKLRIKTLSIADDPVEDIQTRNLTVRNGSNMYLNYPKFTSSEAAALPGCTDPNNSNNHSVSWQKHKVSGSERYFLVCGNAQCADDYEDVEGACQPRCDKCQEEDFFSNNRNGCCSRCAENSTFGSPLRGECHDFKWNSVTVSYWRHPDPSAGGSCWGIYDNYSSMQYSSTGNTKTIPAVEATVPYDEKCKTETPSFAGVLPCTGGISYPGNDDPANSSLFISFKCDDVFGSAQDVGLNYNAIDCVQSMTRTINDPQGSGNTIEAHYYFRIECAIEADLKSEFK